MDFENTENIKDTVEDKTNEDAAKHGIEVEILVDVENKVTKCSV